MFDFVIDSRNEGLAVISVMGRMDDASRNYFFGCVQDLIKVGFEEIVIDCDGLGAISSGSLAGLINARRQAEKVGGKIFLTNINATIAEVFHITKLDKLFKIFPDSNQLVEKILSKKLGVPQA